MSTLSAARTVRDDAKERLDTRLGLIRSELEARSVGGRIVDKLVGETADVALEAADVAATHKAIVGGTFGAIMLWFARRPIISGFRRVAARIRKWK